MLLRHDALTSGVQFLTSYSMRKVWGQTGEFPFFFRKLSKGDVFKNGIHPSDSYNSNLSTTLFWYG